MASGDQVNHEALTAERALPGRSASASHTPGPWKIAEHRRDGDVDIVAPIGIFNNNGIARAFDLWDRDGGRPVRDANALLIAAAPDMLAALIAARGVIDPKKAPLTYERVCDAITSARGSAVLSKAEPTR